MEDLVGASGQILEHLLASAPKQDGRELMFEYDPDRDNRSDVPFSSSVRCSCEEAEGRTQPSAIDELHHGEQFLQLVLERRSRQHERVAALQLFDGARSRGGPVADALRFVQNDEVRLKFVHIAHIFEDQFVTGEVEESWGTRRAPCAAAVIRR